MQETSANVPHFKEDVADFFPDFEQWVEGAADWWDTGRLEVVLFVR